MGWLSVDECTSTATHVDGRTVRSLAQTELVLNGHRTVPSRTGVPAAEATLSTAVRKQMGFTVVIDSGTSKTASPVRLSVRQHPLLHRWQYQTIYDALHSQIETCCSQTFEKHTGCDATSSKPDVFGRWTQSSEN